MSQRVESLIREACRLEVLAPKPGNVHPGASFADMTAHDLLAAADAVAPILARSRESGVGRAVLESVRASRRVADCNANLGIILLIAPLAAVPEGEQLEAGIVPVLSSLTEQDAEEVVEAIRIAAPGGLGKIDEHDVSESPTLALVELMRLAADRDRVARQYASGFTDVLAVGVPELVGLQRQLRDPLQAIIGLHLKFLARWPDSLIARKCGNALAEEASRRAADVLARGWPHTSESLAREREFDEWLRADGHRRNPGTTADLIAATLFAYLRDRPILRSGRIRHAEPAGPGDSAV